MSFHTKYRPKTLDEIWGNQETVQTLKNMFKKEDHPRTYLFSGESGCGKTTTARACVPEIGSAEVIEFNIADQRNIDDARNILRGLEFMPIQGKRVYIFDECHKANDFWSDAMLKALEEPPEWAYFFLCTTDPGKLKNTIRNRCQEFKFAPLSARMMQTKITALTEELQASIETAHISMIVETGAGIPRTTLELLEKVITSNPEDRDDLLQTITAPPQKKLGMALLNKDLAGALSALEADKGRGAESIRAGVMGYMASVIKNNVKRGDMSSVGKAYKIMYSFKDPIYTEPGLVYAITDSICGG